MQRIRTLYVAIIAFLAVFVVEGGLFTIAISAENQSASFWGAVVIESVLLIALFGNALADQMEWNLRKQTPDPSRTWMLLHGIYWLAGAFNGILLYGLFLYITFNGKSSSNWLLLTGSNFIFALAANFLVMRALGQEYRSLRGSCLAGAASFARLARGMIERKNRYGIDQLLVSMRMAKVIFRGLSFVPHEMDAVTGTLVTLRETRSWSSESLSHVASSLEQLPKLDSLPGAFKDLIEKLEWPRGFDPINTPRRFSDYPKLTIIFTAVLAVAGVVALFSETIRQAVLQAFGSFAIQNSTEIGGAVALFIGFIVVVRTLSWPVPFIALRYWPRNSLATEQNLVP